MFVSNDYQIECPEILKREIENTSSTINWFNFSKGDIFHSEDGFTEYQITNVSHEEKSLTLNKN